MTVRHIKANYLRIILLQIEPYIPNSHFVNSMFSVLF